uniref:Uncharacterized protein n=1 Tax=Tanacetum cinerariifolium TaxID=118510 RepID=A0A6L2JH62_TANCI|nr:hypothetical protein [Tanacetum cinerariifolium]
MLHELGEVNPVHAYYNGSRISKDNEDPSWSTSFKIRRTSKTSSALEDFICVVFVLDRSISENLEWIMAREEVVIPPPPPPSINHLHLISMMMMMESMKGPRVQILSTSVKPKSSTVKSKFEMSTVVDQGQSEKPYFLLFLSSSSNNSTMNSTKASSSNPYKKIKLTIIPSRKPFVNISSDEDVTTTHSPTTTFSSPTPPNAPSKTTSTNQTSSSQENTSTSFQSKLQISPPSSNEPTSPHPVNPFLDNISNVPPRPLNPQPLQSHPFLDITLSLPPITPLDHIHDTPSLPSPP